MGDEPTGMGWAQHVVEELAPWASDARVTRAAAVIDRDDVHLEPPLGALVGHTFAIGSITKTMTATVLASLHLHDSLDLDTHLGDVFDAGAAAGVTFRELVTHSSGLPRLAPNALDHPGFDESDPYAAYTPALALDALRSCEPGPKTYEYSNWGFQLLALAICSITGRPLAELFRSRLWEPLGMHDTFDRMEGGHRPMVPGRHRGHEVPRWTDLIAGAGGVESTIDDLARYAHAVLDPPDGPVGDAIALATDPDQPLAWVTTANGWTWHNGGEAGGSSMLIVDRSNGHAICGLAADLNDPLDRALVAAMRGEPIPPPPGPIPSDHPAWTCLHEALHALRAGNLNALEPLLGRAFHEHPDAIASIPDALETIGTIPDREATHLPGQPPAITVELTGSERSLLLVSDDDNHLGGLTTYPTTAAPPW